MILYPIVGATHASPANNTPPAQQNIMNHKYQIRNIIHRSIAEDSQDITSRKLFSSKDKAVASVTAQKAGILCGVDVASQVFKRMDPNCIVKIYKKDGHRVSKGSVILKVSGKTIAILSAERKVLNFLQHLSGVATLTSQYVNAVKGTKVKILDTRKTIPGLRFLQKYAVRCGGGTNHRMNLSQLALVKDNHLKALGMGDGGWGMGNNLKKIKNLRSNLSKKILLEIEAKTMSEVKLALNSKADIIMLDNMPVPSLKKAIRLIHRFSYPLSPIPHPQIEVSGGVTLKNVRKIAKLGVDRISIGAITHSAPALDLSLDLS